MTRTGKTLRNVRTGLRICGTGGHPEVKRALIRFARWLRTVRDFPVRLPVYLHAHTCHVTVDGSRVCASFFAPDHPDVEPYARIATGDYPSLKKARGRDDALAAFVCSLAHEIGHYDQWLAQEPLSESKAIRLARRTLERYARAVGRP
jgi:hypothetical protein